MQNGGLRSPAGADVSAFSLIGSWYIRSALSWCIWTRVVPEFRMKACSVRRVQNIFNSTGNTADSYPCDTRGRCAGAVTCVKKSVHEWFVTRDTNKCNKYGTIVQRYGDTDSERHTISTIMITVTVAKFASNCRSQNNSHGCQNLKIRMKWSNQLCTPGRRNNCLWLH